MVMSSLATPASSSDVTSGGTSSLSGQALVASGTATQTRPPSLTSSRSGGEPTGSRSASCTARQPSSTGASRAASSVPHILHGSTKSSMVSANAIVYIYASPRLPDGFLDAA